LSEASAEVRRSQIAGQVHVLLRRKLAGGLLHARDQRERGLALLAPDLAPDEVVRLDAGGAFVDRGDARVAQVLRGARLLDEAHAAVDLDAERGDLDAVLGGPALHHRDQQVDQRLARAARSRRVLARAVEDAPRSSRRARASPRWSTSS
jgi:hypothetical protein